MNPEISVIMPVYNTEKYVGEAIESILTQSFKNFELIIIDDGSSDGSFEVCQKYAKKDKRIRLYKNEENLRIVQTLNKGISLALGIYIARMDSDDIIISTKLEKQYDYFIKYPDTDILSSHLNFIDKKGKKVGERTYNLNVQKTIGYESPICHACAMIKRNVFEEAGMYDERFNLAEDYELWFRFYSKGYKFAILNDTLYSYRVFDDSGKVKHLKTQLKMTIHVKEFAIKNYHISFSLGNYMRLYLEKIMYYFIPSVVILKLFMLIKGK